MHNKSVDALEYKKVLEDVAIYAKTEQSKKLCLNFSPLNSLDDIKYALNCTQEAVKILDLGIDIPIDYICDTKLIKNRTEYFTPEELIDIAKTLRTSRLIKNFLKENCQENDIFFQIGISLFSDKSLEDKIFETFDANLEINPNISPELKGLFASLRDTEKNLKDKTTELLNTPEFSKHLQEQIYTLRDDRIVFQVRASSKSKINGIVHDVSASNKSFYIEPTQIIPLGNKIREIKLKIRAEIIRILITLTKELKPITEELVENINNLSEIDFHFTKARYAIKTKSICPVIADSKEINLTEMRHPLLIDRIDNLIANDFHLGDGYNTLIITGSNTGGKTVALKTVGLFVLMLKSGFFLPCAEAKIFPFDKIFADIGDEQNIFQNLSTFSSHMKNLISIVNESDENSLVLIDEICAGTDPLEGAVLAEVILKELSNKNSFSVVTTHYGQLKSLEYTDNNFKNGAMEFNSETLQPTYKLIIGVPGLSNAIIISANLGLSQRLVNSATEILNNQKDTSGVLLEKLQSIQHDLNKEMEDAKSKNKEATELKEHYEKELKIVQKESKKTIKQIKAKFDNELELIKDDMKEIVDDMRKEKTEKIARRSYARLAKIETEFRENINELGNGLNDYYEEIDWTIPDKDLIGKPALLKELNQEVTIISKPDKNGQVKIQMGMINTKVKKERLAVYDKALTKVTKLPNYSITTSKHVYKKETLSNTLDLRGLRVEDGLDKLEIYLDKASLINLTPVSVIHGHGTGAMKSAVRDFLKNSPYVKTFRAGEQSEGGDGISIIDLK